jgi:Fe-S oxidoreductase
VPIASCRSLLVLGYEDIWHAADPRSGESASRARFALEAVDDTHIKDMKLMREHEQDIAMLPEGKGWLLVEFGAEDARGGRRAGARVHEASGEGEGRAHDEAARQAAEREQLWQVREGGLGATAFNPMEADHWEGWEDAAVHPEKLGGYLRDFQAARPLRLRHVDVRAFRRRLRALPDQLRLRSAGGIAKWREFVDEAADLVVSYGGSLSGEHGDGSRAASSCQDVRRGPRAGVPRVQVDLGSAEPDEPAQGRRSLSDRLEPEVGRRLHGAEVDTFFSYPEDGGKFAHAAMRCVGAGKCRDIESGTMCPSYMVTLDEQHSTRGRTRILYEMLQGDVIEDGFRSAEVKEALDLCLSCKGCKGDCPVSVDMATYKAEFLSKHFKRRLRPRAAYSMGLINVQCAACVADAAVGEPVARFGVVKRLGGIATEREMPKFAKQTFKDWFAARACPNPQAEPVVLFADTFNNYLHPQVAKAAVRVLEDAGYRVVVPQTAVLRAAALRLRDAADGAAVSAPACSTAWRRGSIPACRSSASSRAVSRSSATSCPACCRQLDATRLSMQTLTLAEFLDQHLRLEPPRLEERAIVHGHCHQKAVMGMSAEQKLYERMGLDFELLDSGCCGLAGSWGFEEGHYDLLGEDRRAASSACRARLPASRRSVNR